MLENPDQPKSWQKRTGDVLIIMALVVIALNGGYYLVSEFVRGSTPEEQLPAICLLFVVAALLFIAAAHFHDLAKGISHRIALFASALTLGIGIGIGAAFGLFGEIGKLFQ